MKNTNIIPKGTPLKVIGKLHLVDTTYPLLLEKEMKYLPNPLVEDEVVIVMEPCKPEDRYIKVRHAKGKAVSVFDKQWLREVRKKKITDTE